MGLKYDAWLKWADEIRGCCDCFEDCKTKFTDVPWYRQYPAAVMVGEAPSLNRTKPGFIFGERSQQVFEALLKAMQLTRESVYATNLTKCSIPHNYIGNPDNCLKWFWEELKILKPDTVLLFGRKVVDAVSGNGHIPLNGHEFYRNNIRCISYTHPMHVVYTPELYTSYLEGAKALGKKLRQRPPKIEDYFVKEKATQGV